MIGSLYADTLYGGEGTDRLFGGSGLDTYLLDGSAGTEVLIDEDGGVIRYQDRILTGGKESAPGSGEWQDGAARYRLVSDGERQHLLISAGAGTVLVQDWHNGHLGIQLQDAPAAPSSPSADLVLHGDRAPLDHAPEADGVQSRTDALGNVIVKPDQIEADRPDTLYDSTSNGQLFGHGGNDNLNAWRGGDRLFARFEQSDADAIREHKPTLANVTQPGELLAAGAGCIRGQSPQRRLRRWSARAHPQICMKQLHP